MITTPAYAGAAPEAARFHFSRISWGAVFTGLFLALVTYLFLTVLGTAIGASAIDPMEAGNPLAGFGTGAGIWVGLSTLIALAVGAFFAGRTAPGKGTLHGVLCWAVTTLVTVYALSSLVGGAVGTATRVAGSGVALAGQGVAAVAPSIASGVKDELQKNGVSLDFGDLQRQLETLLRQSGKPELNPDTLKSQAGAAAQDGKATGTEAATTPQNAGNDLAAFFDRLRQRAQPALDAADRDALVNIIMARTGKTRPEAEQIAANYEQTYNQAVARYEQLKVQAEQKAREAGDAAAKGMSRAAWAGVVVLLLGGLVSGASGFLGRRSARREEVLVVA
ncbi:hypothetical protein [uncultured Pseudacidovorax sp.]|uniref:hypothetical protein n=1 Tax=uncultured Pseudacidovorax sp. TaxID=679313 RepID=UPI0025D6234B|nr:hypothetical protein [uncultured Pseudacidovorax sp.]